MLYEYHRARELTGHGRKRCKPTTTKRRRVCEHCGKDITLRYTESTGDCSITKAIKLGLKVKKQQCRVQLMK